MRTPSLLALLFLALSLTGCTGLRGQTRDGASGGTRDCASCKRMCEVAGDARENPAAVEKCKQDCERKCR